MPHFVDTNVVAYAFSKDARKLRALDVLSGAHLSVQVLNELTLVARRKWGRNLGEIETMIAWVVSACSSIAGVDEAVHAVGRQMAERYRVGVYDSFIVSAALLSNCDILYSEDLRDIEGVMTIRNPFG